MNPLRLPFHAACTFTLAAVAATSLAACSGAPEDGSNADGTDDVGTTHEAIEVIASVIISQVYGGGGNIGGAPYANDFIELYNRGDHAVSLNGWSIQYASATGAATFGAGSTMFTQLPNVTLQPGRYYLIQEGKGTQPGPALPTPDLVDPSPVALSATAGKVALVKSSNPLGCNGGSVPCTAAQLANVVDLVGYGNATLYEGAGPAPLLSTVTAAQRNVPACFFSDSNNNQADFVAAAPAPHGSSSSQFCSILFATP